MRRFTLLRRAALPVALAAAIGCFALRAAQAQTITVSCSSLGIESELCRSGAEEWAKTSGAKVAFAPTPSNADERFALYLTLLAASSPDIDIFQIDTTWPGALAGHFVDLSSAVSAEDRADHLDALIANNTIEGKLIALPFFVDAGLLYYRTDLLEKYKRKPPQNWAELAETAKIIIDGERAAGQPDMQGFVWQGRAYEGLVCNALEWIASDGGAIVDAKGKITAASAVRSIERAKGWIGTISPPGVLNYAEEDARSAFQSGKSVFMRNWPYAWALANAADSPVKGKVGVTLLPQGDGAQARHAATLGGQQLAVSRYSRNRDKAIDLVKYLTSKAEQKRRALVGSFNPTRRSLYEDREVLAANPFYAGYLDILTHAVLRPSSIAGTRYNRVSNEMIQSIHAALSGRGGAQENMERLQQALNRISRNGEWR